MALKITVKVGSISNLSDARYCAGMGVDILGFRVLEGQEHYIGPGDYQELRGWISGPKVAAELYGLRDHERLQQILKDYQPDLIELSIHEFITLLPDGPPVIVRLTDTEYSQHMKQLQETRERIQYLLLYSNDEEQIGEIATKFPVLLNVMDHEVQSLLPLPIAGIALQGSKEEKPGYKTYDQLAVVLEQLEDDNG